MTQATEVLLQLCVPDNIFSLNLNALHEAAPSSNEQLSGTPIISEVKFLGTKNLEKN